MSMVPLEMTKGRICLLILVQHQRLSALEQISGRWVRMPQLLLRRHTSMPPLMQSRVTAHTRDSSIAGRSAGSTAMR